MKRKILTIVLLAAISVFIYSLYQYNKPHRNIGKEKASFSLSVEELYSQFEANIDQASTKYADKVMTLSGKIAKVEQNQSGGFNVLMKGENLRINCEMDPAARINTENLKTDLPVKIKGLFIGFDDLLQEVQFKKCSIIN